MHYLIKLANENLSGEFSDNRPAWEFFLKDDNRKAAIVLDRFGTRHAFYVSRYYPKTYNGYIGIWTPQEQPYIGTLIKWIHNNA